MQNKVSSNQNSCNKSIFSCFDLTFEFLPLLFLPLILNRIFSDGFIFGSVHRFNSDSGMFTVTTNVVSQFIYILASSLYGSVMVASYTIVKRSAWLANPYDTMVPLSRYGSTSHSMVH